MTILEAKKILRHFYDLSNPTEEEEFLYTEALQFLIAETKDSDHMLDLGGFYYDKREFDLALKYYEMAAEYGNRYAISNLGYIWYYGRTGEKDYEKAFKYFDKARAMGDIVAAYKVADMYRNGYYVEKDYDKYREIILSLYPKVKNARRLGEPLPEIFTCLAKIYSEEGKTEEALSLYDTARDFLAQRIRGNPFFGNLTIMKWLIHDVYELREFDPAAMDLYDLYHVLRTPAKVSFFFEQDRHEAEAVEENGALVIRFDDTWFRTIDDFFLKAELFGELVTTRYEELYDFEVEGAENA